MPSAGHRKSRRAPWRVGLTRTAAVPAVGVTAIAAAAIATLTAVAEQPEAATDAASMRSDIIGTSLATRDTPPVSRSAARAPLPDAAAAEEATAGAMFLIDDTELRSSAGEDAPVLATLGKGTQITVGEAEENGFRQVIHHDLIRWVPADLLSATEPAPEPEPEPEPEAAPAEAGVATGECPSGSSVESGLQPDTIAVHRAVCAAFPEVSSYGGVAGRGEHATGHALDIMISGEAGWRIAEYLQANASRLGIDYLIYEQKIWSVGRSGEGWRPMSSRGGGTADHYDHVHVTTRGAAGTG